MTVSILETLAITPTGEPGLPLSLESLGWYLRTHCDKKEDKDREARHRRRDVLYRDGGVEYILQLIEQVFTHDKVRQLRAAWAPYARFSNPLKVIVNQLSTVYSEPARRTVSATEGANAQAYSDLLDAVDFDVIAQEINRLYNLHRILLAGFRVRTLPDGSREPLVSVVTPTDFRVVFHPNDTTLPVGYLIRTASRSMRGLSAPLPAWVLWTDHERVQLTKDFMPIPGSYLVHGVGLCPYIVIRRSSGLPDFWPGEEGEDLAAAEIANWFTNLLLLKETKSANKQAITTGGSEALRGQAADIEMPSELPEGASMVTVDLSMDLALFKGTSEHIQDSAANDYGINQSMRKHQGVQSADARELMRVPLRELRKEQLPMFRRFERRFALLMAAVMKVDLPREAFIVEEFGVDFGEMQQPMLPEEELNVFEKMRQLGIDNVIDYLRRKDPDLTEDMARAQVEANVATSTWHLGLLREFQALAGGMAEGVTAQPGQDGAPPQEQAPPQKPVSISEGKAA